MRFGTIAAIALSLAFAPGAGAPDVRVEQQENQLTVTIESGEGRVTSNPAGINCTETSDPCTASFPSDAVVVLTGRPAFGFAVDGWGTPDCPADSKKTCRIEMGGFDRFATAHFRPRAILQIARVGRGTITASPRGQRPIFTQASCDFSVDEIEHCELAYLPGTRVRLTARPTRAGSRVARWSVPGCGARRHCTVRLNADYQSVVATFSPLRLGVRVSGRGRVTTPDAKIAISCGGGDVCEQVAPYRPGTRVIVTAFSGQRIEFVKESFCRPFPRRGTTQRCRAFVNSDPTWIGVRFGNAPPPDLPGNIKIAFRVVKAGGGRGTVRGSGIECGGRCLRKYDFGVRARFTARPSSGSKFRRWVGACGRRSVCTLPVGPVTTLRAVFVRR